MPRISQMELIGLIFRYAGRRGVELVDHSQVAAIRDAADRIIAALDRPQEDEDDESSARRSGSGARG
jgi:hypothetical protein